MTENPILNKLVKDLTVGPRAAKALDRGGIRTIGDLVAKDAWELMDIRGFGLDCLIRVNAGLAEMGLALKSSNFRFRA